MVNNIFNKNYQILISGGITRERESGIEDVNEYNPDFDQWMTRASMNQARDSHTMIPKAPFDMFYYLRLRRYDYLMILK